MRKTATINIRVNAELKAELDKLGIDISKFIREKLIYSLCIGNDEISKQARLEAQISRTTKILQVLNATKIIYEKLRNPRHIKIISDEVLKTLYAQKDATQDEEIKKICEDEIKEIKNKLNYTDITKENSKKQKKYYEKGMN